MSGVAPRAHASEAYFWARGTQLVELEPSRFAPVPGVLMPHRHPIQWTARGVRVLEPSPLAQLGTLAVGPVADREALCALLEARWWALAEETERALLRARRVAPSARVALDPWRLEAQLDWGPRDIILWFSPRGDRALIMAMDGRSSTLAGAHSFEIDRAWRASLEAAVRSWERARSHRTE